MIDQEYNFTASIDKHTANVNKWVDDVSSYDRVVVFITTHAHDETGDLYGGPGFSSDPYGVLNGLFPKSLRRAFKDGSVYLNFLVCGGFAETLSSRMVLFKAARQLHAHEAIAFSSPGLIPSLTNGFWLDFAFRFMIKGASLGDALPYMLSATSTSQFVRHTNLLYVKIPESNTEPVVCSEVSLSKAIDVITNCLFSPWTGSRHLAIRRMGLDGWLRLTEVLFWSLGVIRLRHELRPLCGVSCPVASSLEYFYNAIVDSIALLFYTFPGAAGHNLEMSDHRHPYGPIRSLALIHICFVQ
ncbi:hypothetical protein FIBSPDRAFT_886886 [Athelia psychrophila]|uniref:Uncharacterized protein n=1 Tax=Athelia psychrophila TaxID=1759441 RepID=A0A166QCA0_9AGAM|nr:hypothetical protein FIBSPDRAFT_886886 [Fibularhizoctonia sp. CBS 109695]